MKFYDPYDMDFIDVLIFVGIAIFVFGLYFLTK